MCHENFSQQERRRSARIIAQEERKENERKALLASARNKSQNLQATNKDKGKNVIDVGDDFRDDFDYEDEPNVSTRKRGRKHKALNQLISSTQGGQYPETSAWRTGIYDLNDMPQKHVFEFVLDVLQRKDPNEYFAEPVNPNEVKGYYDIVKQPMDFGTMRAKLQENMYTTMEELEHDVHLMCNNAMTFNARSSVYYKVASTIMDRARSIFVGLRANPENFDFETLVDKRRGRRKTQGRYCRAVQLPTKHDEESYGAHHEVEERRYTYSPPKDESLVSQVLQGPKQSFELNEAHPSYEESLENFVQGLGPVAQKVARKKLETLKIYQLWSGETASLNHPSNSSDRGITQQPTPQATPTQQHEASYNDLMVSHAQQLTPLVTPTQQHEASYNDIMLSHTQQLTPQATPIQQHEPSYSDLMLSHALPLSNRPLSIPGAAAATAAQDRNINTNIEHGESVRNKGKAICVDEGNYDATAAALLGSIFQNYDKGESSSAYQGEASSSSNIRRPIHYDLNSDVDTCDPSMDQMVPSFENEAPIQVYGQDSIHHQNRDLLQLSAYNNNASSGQCSNPPGMSDTLLSTYLGRPSRVRSQVWPTRVISGPQPNHSQSRYGQSLLSQSSLPYNYQADCFYGNNYSAPSQLSHRRSSTGLISAINSRRQAILPSQAADQPSWLSSLYQPGNLQQLLGSSYNCSPLFALNTYGYGMNHTTPTYGYRGMDPMSFIGYGRRASLQGRRQEGSTAQFLWDEKNHPDLALQL